MWDACQILIFKQMFDLGNHLGLEISEDKWDEDIIGGNVLDEFLDVENCLTLCVFLKTLGQRKQISFSKEVILFALYMLVYI